MAAAPLGPGASIDKEIAALTQTQAQHSQMLAQHSQMLAQHAVQLQKILAQLGAIDTPAGLAATAQQILDARARNATTEDPAAPLTIMPLARGALPPHWPAAGLTREALFRGPVAIVDDLLGDYNIMPLAHAEHAERRNILARHLGTHRS